MLERKDLMAGQPDVDWLIEGVLPIGYRALLYADSGVGKSFTALDIALHIATGTRWQGYAVKQGRVYYLAAENPETFRARFQAWEKQHKGFARWEKANPDEPDAPFYLDPTPLDLSSKIVVDALLARLGPARLVVIDTVLASMGAWDIKDTNQSYLALAQVNRIIEQTGATVLLVHHTPDKGYNPLGGSAWRGGIQTRIYLTRQHNGKDYGEDGDFQDGDTITLACKKLTGAPQFPNVVVPVHLVKLSRDLTVPVLASEKAKARSNPSPKPKSCVSCPRWTCGRSTRRTGGTRLRWRTYWASPTNGYANGYSGGSGTTPKRAKCARMSQHNALVPPHVPPF